MSDDDELSLSFSSSEEDSYYSSSDEDENPTETEGAKNEQTRYSCLDQNDILMFIDEEVKKVKVASKRSDLSEVQIKHLLLSRQWDTNSIVEDLKRGDSKNLQAGSSPRKVDDDLLLKSFVCSREDIVWCPAEDCNLAIKMTSEFAGEFNVKCQNDHEICFDCQLFCHDPVDCYQLKVWLKMMKDAEKKIKEDEKKIEEDEKKRKKEEIKTCPGKCGLDFQKDGGCSNMTCSIPTCGVSYCWDCLQILNPDEGHYCQQEKELQPEEVLKKFENKFLESYVTNESSLEVEKSITLDDKNHDFYQKIQLKKVSLLNYCN